MEKHQHFILHKPWGTISQFVNPAKRKKKLLGELSLYCNEEFVWEGTTF